MSKYGVEKYRVAASSLYDEDTLDDLFLDKNERIVHKRRLDDGTRKTTTSHVKFNKPQRLASKFEDNDK